MATLQEISMQAGTSVATVSMVLSGKDAKRVSDRTRTKIKRIAEDMGYFPNAAARMVKTGRFGQIACLITEYRKPQQDLHILGHLCYVDEVTKLLADRGYSTIVEPVYLNDQTDELLEISRLFSEISVDGIVGIEAMGIVPPEIDQRIRDMGTPVVWLNRMHENERDVPCVRCDEAIGAGLLVDHLVELGHRRIAYIGVEGRHYSGWARKNGVIQSLERHGLDTSLVRTSKRILARELAVQLLQASPRPTAMICYNRDRYDLVLHKACQLGICVPDDLSLCCFSAANETDVAGFHITAAVIPEGKISKAGVDCLIDRIKSRQAPNLISDVAPNLVIGETTTPPSAST